MPTEMVQFNVRLPATLLERLKVEAHAAQMNLSEYVRTKLTLKDKPQLTGLAQRVAALEAWQRRMQRWQRGWGEG